MKPSFLLITAFVACLVACGGEEGPDDPPGPETFEFTIGSAADALTGAGGFEPVDDTGDYPELPLRSGSQGGMHVYLNLRLPADAIDEVSTKPLIYREARRISDNTLVSRIEHKTNLVPVSDGVYDTERSISLFLCPTPVGIDVAFEPLEVTVSVSPDYGEDPVSESKMRFVPVCPADEDEFCRQVCLW